MDSSADPNPRSIRLSMSMTSLGSPGFPASLRMAFSEVDLAPIQETPKVRNSLKNRYFIDFWGTNGDLLT